MVNYKKEYPDGVARAFWADFIFPMIKQIKGDSCEKCNSKNYLDIHHTSYDIVNINTLKVLCRSCHKLEHNKK